MMSRPKIISGLSLIILTGVILYGLQQARQTAKSRLQMGLPMPDFQLRDEDGDLGSGRAFSGRNYGLLFFRADCEHCQRELMEIDRLLPQFAGRLPFLVVSLNSAEETRQAIEHWRLTMTPYFAPVALARSLGVRSVPLLVLVGADGRISYVQTGERSLSFQRTVFERFLQGDSLAEADLRKIAQRPAAVSPAAGAGCDIP